MTGRMAILLSLAACLRAEGVPVRAKAGEYPVHKVLPKLSIGVEYHVRSMLEAKDISVALRDHLVVLVALFPAKGETLRLSSEQFSLRLDGRKGQVMAQGPGFVAASLKYPDWERRRRLTAEGGVGDVGVIVGRPDPQPRFPGDQRVPRQRWPVPPKDPSPGLGSERAPPERPEEAVVRLALVEGATSEPVAGYLYFPYKGKTEKLKSVELLYRGEAGEAALRLQ